MGAHEADRSSSERLLPNYVDLGDEAWESRIQLGQDLRLVLAAVGGGAIRIGRELVRRHIRHLETVAINCDPKVEGFEEFDHRVYLGPDTGVDGDTGGSPFVGGLLARAAEPVLDRIFRGATFVILVGSLGGGAGSGAFPYVLEVASRHAEIVSAFVVKPFRCEGERRALAERAIGRLHLVEAFAEKRERGCATLQTLDNESLVGPMGRTAFARVGQHWASLLEDHIERAFLAPAESILDTIRTVPVVAPPNPATFGPIPELTVPGTLPPPAAPELPPLLPAAQARLAEAELTFEVVTEIRPPTP